MPCWAQVMTDSSKKTIHAPRAAALCEPGPVLSDLGHDRVVPFDGSASRRLGAEAQSVTQDEPDLPGVLQSGQVLA